MIVTLTETQKDAQLAWKTAEIVEQGEQGHNRKHKGNSYSEAFKFLHIHTRKSKWELRGRAISAKAFEKNALFFNSSFEVGFFPPP